MSTRLADLGRAIKQLQTRHHRAIETRLTAIGSSLAQWDAIRAIHRNPGATSHALATYTFQTDQSFGALAARMLEKGLVRRTEGKGRAVGYELTAAGAEILAVGTKIADDVLTASFASLDEAERETLSTLLNRLLAASDD